MNHDGAPQRSPVGTIAGQVLAGGRPVPQAIVMIIEGEATYPDLAALTDDDGQFMLGAFTPGWYRLEARLGERVHRRRVDVQAGDQQRLEIVL
jgi:Carboxypeptidase regulatory-like domain